MIDIPAAIRDVLACPRCHGTLRDGRSGAADALVCDACGLAFPVEEGIPVLLLERAVAVSALGD